MQKLSDAGLDTADLLLEATATQIAEVIGSDEVAAKDIQTAVREQVEAAARAAAEAEARENSDKSGVSETGISDVEPPSKTSPKTTSSDEESKDSN